MIFNPSSNNIKVSSIHHKISPNHHQISSDIIKYHEISSNHHQTIKPNHPTFSQHLPPKSGLLASASSLAMRSMYFCASSQNSWVRWKVLRMAWQGMNDVWGPIFIQGLFIDICQSLPLFINVCRLSALFNNRKSFPEDTLVDVISGFLS